MSSNISIFLNNIHTSSEVFLRQLFHAIDKTNKVEVLTFSKIKRVNEKCYFRTKNIAKPKSLYFLLHVLPIALKYKTTRPKTLYYLFVLEMAKANKLYFPFLYMLVPFKDALKLYKQLNPNKRIYSSIRGTEVTINPFTKDSTVSDYKYILQFVDKIHFLSEKLREQYLQLGLPDWPNTVIYQGVDKKKFYKGKTHDLPTDKLRLISIGRYDYVKGFEYLILTCSELKKMGINFECSIVGYGTEKDKYDYMIHDLGLQKEVKLVTNVNHLTLPKIITSHNVYVHTHLVTGISNSMLEAFSSGLPIISFYSDFDSYQIPGLNNYFIETPRYNYAALANKLKDFSYTNTIIESEIDKVLYKFTLEYQVEKFIQFFH